MHEMKTGEQRHARDSGSRSVAQRMQASERRTPRTVRPTRDVAQPMLKAFLAWAKPVAFPGLKAGPGTFRLIYRLDHLFSGYHINGSFTAQPNKYSLVHIKYIEKTEASKGFGHLLKDLEKGAREVGSTGVNLSVSECKEGVVERLVRFAKEENWSCGVTDAGNGVTGPDMFLSKALPKSSGSGVPKETK